MPWIYFFMLALCATFVSGAAQSEDQRVITADELTSCCGMPPYAERVAAHLTKLANEHPDCMEKLEPYNAGKSNTRGTEDNPSFFVQCGAGSAPNVVRFTLEDIEAGAIAKKREPLEKQKALEACEAEAKKRVDYPDSVEFSYLWDASYQAQPDGSVMVRSSFKANNDFGMKQKLWISCWFDPEHSVKDVQIKR